MLAIATASKAGIRPNRMLMFNQPDANVQYFPAPSQLLASFQGPHGTRHTDARSLKFDYCTIVHKFVFLRRDGR